MRNQTRESIAFEAYMLHQNKKLKTVELLVAMFECKTMVHFLAPELQDGFSGWVHRFLEERPEYRNTIVVQKLLAEIQEARKQQKEMEKIIDEMKE